MISHVITTNHQDSTYLT